MKILAVSHGEFKKKKTGLADRRRPKNARRAQIEVRQAHQHADKFCLPDGAGLLLEEARKRLHHALLLLQGLDVFPHEVAGIVPRVNGLGGWLLARRHVCCCCGGGGRGPRGAGWPRCENGERSGGGGGSCSRAVTRRGKRGQFFPGAENCGAGRDGVSGKSGQFSGRAAVGAFERGRGCRQALTATGCPCVKVESLGLWRVRRSLLVFLGQNGDECCPKIHLKKN